MAHVSGFPARFNGQCPWCRRIILRSHRPGEGHDVAWIEPEKHGGKKRLVHVWCAQDYDETRTR